MFCCEKCAVFFLTKSGRCKHQKKCNGVRKDFVESKFICQKCGKGFQAKHGLKQHKETKNCFAEGESIEDGIKRKACGIPGCEAVFRSTEEVCTHLRLEHGRPAEVQSFEFASETDFLQWMKTESEKAISWEVKSGTAKGVKYEVTRLRPQGCPCNLKCRKCGVCPDLYICSCADSARLPACKHIHLVHKLHGGSISSEMVDIEHPDVQSGPGSAVLNQLMTHETKKRKLPQNFSLLPDRIHSIGNSVCNVTNVRILSVVTQKVCEIEALLRSSEVPSTSFPNEVTRDTHQRQKMDTQMLDFPRRKKKQKKEEAQSKE